MLKENEIPAKVAILVFACDRYELLFKGFVYFFHMYWDHVPGMKRYFATESINANLHDFVNIKSGKGEWTNRLKKVLDRIDEDYVIFFQEDMWLKKEVMSGVISSICNYTIKNQLSLVKLHSSPVYITETIHDVDFEGLRLGKVLKEDSDFLMSHQISIWRKEFLYKQLKDNEHPWRNERRGTKRLKKSSDELYLVDVLSENGGLPRNENKNHVTYGAYDTVSVNACVHTKTAPFIKELSPYDQSYADKLKYHMDNEITHDGKPKPRKEDLTKKIRKRVKSFFRR